MFDRLSILRDKLRASLWPVPALMLLATLVLFALARLVDAGRPDPDWLRAWWLHSGTGDDARNLLSTLVAAIITMSSVVFSITIVALTLAAGQFGSRLVRTYMADLRSKLALGLFAATILYCLLGLRVVSSDMPLEAVPHVTVSVGLALGTFCILALLFFLHVVARSIIADEVIRRVATELDEQIALLPQLDAAGAVQPGGLPDGFDGDASVVRAAQSGYVRAIEYEEMVRVAQRAGAWVRLQVHAGEYVATGDPIAWVHPAAAATPVLAPLRDAVMLGHTRTPTQDLVFSMRHLIDVALRALSPGINDANTARVVVDHLRGALSQLMGKALPDRHWRDADGVLRVQGQPFTHDELLDAALEQIRHSAAPQPSVVVALVLALGHVLEHARLPEHRDAVYRHAELVAQAGLGAATQPHDRELIEDALNRVRQRWHGASPQGVQLRCAPLNR